MELNYGCEVKRKQKGSGILNF